MIKSLENWSHLSMPGFSSTFAPQGPQTSPERPSFSFLSMLSSFTPGQNPVLILLFSILCFLYFQGFTSGPFIPHQPKSQFVPLCSFPNRVRPLQRFLIKPHLLHKMPVAIETLSVRISQ